ncbi:MT-A70 family methyltransferase [Mammaliicoccus lentus]|uniref:MT-A70 family methyltransferase n=1 Tax=Mammaliicoccus lentus TaxID=42858 RepID=UPI001C4EF405|nr:MT-A70 family methyltransferase [Mammaliicoccus lentus]MBW0768672.1 DNA methyltransferase [Mammaliicoccus lentus]
MKYSVVYGDPPWRYKQSKGQGVAENHYPTMSLNDICSLPIDTISHKDSVLFLWATFPMLQEALQVITAWGFTFKTVAFVWVQNKSGNGYFFGLGHWTRSNAEICLLAVKGRPKRVSKKVHQLIVSPVEGHSKKPDMARDKIVELMGDLPRIELFARQRTAGWDAWGNEVENSLSLENLQRE